MNQKTFIFIGRSGCGKGTQAKLLMDKLAPEKVLYVQTGAEIREFIKGDSFTQKLAKDVYAVGGLFPEFLTVYSWVNVLVKSFENKEHLVFDGTPRKLHEAGALHSIIDFYKLDKPYVIHIDVSKEWSKDRLSNRGRMDDSRDDIEKRLSWYETDVVPAVEFYRHHPNYHFISVNGERSIEDIHKDVMSMVGLS